jgi:hypothetical protein
VKSLKYKIKFPNTRLTRIRAMIDFFIFLKSILSNQSWQQAQSIWERFFYN